MNNLTPIASLLGGILIGIASLLLLATSGRIAGISGICAGLFTRAQQESRWRLVFVAAMLVTGLVVEVVAPSAITVDVDRSLLLFAGAGVLVGVGTQLGGGCTSGHGVCGMGRRSPRSLVATLVFVAVGMLTVFITRSLS